MRIRSVKPGFFNDRVTGRFSSELALFYIAMWCFADDDGRFEWEPEKIQGNLFSYKRDMDVEAHLKALVKAGRVVKYEVDGITYGVILTFKEHQRPQKPLPSSLPPPPLEALPEKYRSTTVAVAPVEEGRGEGEDEESSGEERTRGAGKPRKATDPRLKPLMARLSDTYQQLRDESYKPNWAKDMACLKSLLAVAVEDEIDRRWRSGLVASGWTKVSTVSQLSSKWNDLAPKAKSSVTAPASPAANFTGKAGKVDPNSW